MIDMDSQIASFSSVPGSSKPIRSKYSIETTPHHPHTLETTPRRPRTLETIPHSQWIQETLPHSRR